MRSQHSSGSAGGMFPWMIPMAPSPSYPEDAGAEGAGGVAADGSDGTNAAGSDSGGVGAGEDLCPSLMLNP